MTTLLVVEDDPALRTYLADNLTADGFELLVADSVRDGLRALETHDPALALVDVGLGDGSGLDLIAHVRRGDARASPDQRFMVVSGRADEVDRLRAFDFGADDVVVKPFAYREVLARVRALLRRPAGAADRTAPLRCGVLEVDVLSHTARVRGEPVALSVKEFGLLRALAAEPARVFTKEEILREVWGFRARGTTRTLDSHACRLRRKLGAQGDRFVVNVWGVGYCLLPPELHVSG